MVAPNLTLRVERSGSRLVFMIPTPDETYRSTLELSEAAELARGWLADSLPVVMLAFPIAGYSQPLRVGLEKSHAHRLARDVLLAAAML